MPPKVKFSKNAILVTAFDIARSGGIESVNARSIAGKLGCSTQPLFREYQSMDEIKNDVMKMADAEYIRRIKNHRDDSPAPYKDAGLAFIRFAHEEPELFKMLFFRDRFRTDGFNSDDNDVMEYVIDAIVDSRGYSRDDALRIHRAMTIYSYGLATMVATRYVEYRESRISALLSEQFNALVKLYRPD